MREVLVAPLDADELLDVAPPRRHVRVADRPVDGDALFRVRLVVEIAPPVDAPAPHDGAAADLSSANPVERLVVRVRIRVVEIVDEELARVLIAGAGVALDGLIALDAIAVAHAAIAQLVRHHVLDVVDGRIDRASRLEHDRLETFLRQLFRGPAAGDAGADDDGVVRDRWHGQVAGVKGTLPW